MNKRELLVSIMKKAEGKKFTYFQIETAIGIYSSPVVENLVIEDSQGERIILAGETYDVDQFVYLPLNNIEDITEIEKDEFEIMDAEAEYMINYYDGTIVRVMIYNGNN